MKLIRPNCASCLLLGLLILVVGTSAQADVGPPIKISMPPDTLSAKSGVEYRGVFTVDVREAGTISDFKLHGSKRSVICTVA